jgi:hypothetical protein
MAAQIAEEDVKSTPKPTMETSAGTQAEPDESYFNGIVVIAQYYALFEQGLYEETYQLLSPSRPHAISLEEYVANSEVLQIKETKIIAIRPFYESALQLQSRTTPDPLGRRMFYLQIYEEGENGMAGANTNGVHTYFITVVLENGEWKIYSINTSP